MRNNPLIQRSLDSVPGCFRKTDRMYYSLFSRTTIRLLALVLAVVFSSCRSVSTVSTPNTSLPDNFPNHSLNQILDALPRLPAAFDQMYAESVVAISSPGEKGRFSTRISHNKGDSTLIRVRFPLGIEGARVLITQDSAWVYDRINEEVLGGTHAQISSVLPGAVFGTNFVEDGLGYVVPSPHIEWSVTADSLRYHLISPDSRLRLDVDPALWRVVHIEQKSPEGMVIEQRWYTEFRNINQHLLPLRMTVSRPEEDTRLTMVLRKIETEPEQLSFDLGLKTDTRRVFIRE